MRLLPADRRLRMLALAGYALAGLAALALLLVAAFPIGALKPTIERRLSARFGRPVTIGTLERRDAVSLTPTVLVRDLRVPQPLWAGAGDLARVREAEVTLSTAALLRARVDPTAIRLRGAHLSLVRLKDGRENWHGEDQGDTPSANTPVIERLSIADSTLSYRDAKQDRRVALRLAADPARGLRAIGRGTVRGSPVAVRFTGAPIGGASAAPWPIRVSIEGPDLAMAARGTMASPLDTNRMTLDVTARASDLKFVDAIIETGLFRTQPVALSAHVERVAPGWRIRRLAGTIGRSRIAGALDVRRTDGRGAAARTRLDGRLDFAKLDLDDLASGEAIAAAAVERRTRPRLVPATRVDIGKVDRTDGRVRVRVARFLARSGPPTFRSASGVVTLDRQLLTVAPLRLVLPQGAITGRVVVDQRGDRAMPIVTMDVRLAGASIGSVAGGGGSVTGRLDARAYLVGRGRTIRDAVARSDGRIGLAARDGALPDRMAAALGFDAGRALFADDDARAALRCVIFGAQVRAGQGRVAPMVVDTSRSRLDGTGTLAFPSEALSIRLTGAPKQGALLRLPGEAYLSGTIREPDLVVPREVKSVGNVFRAIGRAITGRQGPRAADADCAALAARVLR